MKTINIFGDIIEDESYRWWDSEISPANVIDALKEAKGEPVEININSNGGSVAGGIAICNAIKQYPGETTCNVLGLAASMASAIACAGKKLTMGEGAFLMIHNPWTYTSGNAEELRKDADTLDKMRDSIVSFYLAKCPDKEKELKSLMDAESWLSRDEAKAAGFAVEDYTGGLKAAASLTRRAFDKAPKAVKDLFTLKTEKPADKPAEANAAKPEAQAEKPEAKKPEDNWEARYKGLSQKYNELKSSTTTELAAQAEDFKAQIDALTKERDSFKAQLDQSGKDLEAAKAKLSALTAKADEDAKALQKAQEDLTAARDSLIKAEDKAKQLENTRDMLTAGVLTPPAESSYADKMKAAKTPEEREALRAQKRAGKIK